MAGTNPYIEVPEIKLPETKYQLTILPLDITLEIDPQQFRREPTGQKGSILDILDAKGIDIDHSCGGVCACSTCHVLVRQGLDSCSEATDDEEDMLDLAPGLTAQSRLACQCVPDGTQDIVVEVPEWNRNLVSEAPH